MNFSRAPRTTRMTLELGGMMPMAMISSKPWPPRVVGSAPRSAASVSRSPRVPIPERPSISVAVEDGDVGLPTDLVMHAAGEGGGARGRDVRRSCGGRYRAARRFRALLVRGGDRQRRGPQPRDRRDPVRGHDGQRLDLQNGGLVTPGARTIPTNGASFVNEGELSVRACALSPPPGSAGGEPSTWGRAKPQPSRSRAHRPARGPQRVRASSRRPGGAQVVKGALIVNTSAAADVAGIRNHATGSLRFPAAATTASDLIDDGQSSLGGDQILRR